KFKIVPQLDGAMIDDFGLVAGEYFGVALDQVAELVRRPALPKDPADEGSIEDAERVEERLVGENDALILVQDENWDRHRFEHVAVEPPFVRGVRWLHSACLSVSGP